MPKKGYKQTEEHKRKVKENNSSYKGMLCGENNPMFGRTGEKNPMFGKTDEKHPRYGKHLSPEIIKKLREENTGKNNPMFGRTGSYHPNFGKCGDKHPNFGKHWKWPEESKGNMTFRLQTHHGPFKDTKPELKMEEILIFLNIPYEKQYRVGNHLADFHLLNTNTLIEVDGDYWHGNPKKFSKLTERQLKQKEKDKKFEQVAKENGFVVLRFWENDILNNAEEVKEKICNIINL